MKLTTKTLKEMVEQELKEFFNMPEQPAMDPCKALPKLKQAYMNAHEMLFNAAMESLTGDGPPPTPEDIEKMKDHEVNAKAAYDEALAACIEQGGPQNQEPGRGDWESYDPYTKPRE